MVEITDDEKRAAEKIFGDRLGLAERFVGHLSTTGIEWGLLGPREIPRLWGRHVLNCAVIAELVDENSRVADVGSGAGLPGIALAIARPDLKLTLIEPLERRVLWLKQVSDDMNLTNVEVIRGRAEQVVDSVDADVVTARAVSALGSLAELIIPLLHGRGTVLAIKGRSAADEVRKAGTRLKRMGGTNTAILTVGAAVLSEPTTVVQITVGR